MVLRAPARKLFILVLVALFAFSQLMGIPVSSAAVSLGTARGTSRVEFSVDGGKSWLPMGAGSFPVLDGIQLRSTAGSAVLELTDGSRIAALPFTALQVQETEGAMRISLVYGRLGFRLPPETRVEILTPSAGLDPVRTQVMVGELFVGPAGLVGLKMTEGALRVTQLTEPRQVVLASLEPVFLPKRPPTTGPLFTSDPAPLPAPGAKGIFTAQGQSIGYLKPDGQLVIEPGFTADLTRPFSPKLVRLAMAGIPEEKRSQAVALFDVNGRYVGYLIGPVFYAQAPAPQAPPTERATGGLATAAWAGTGAVAAAGAGLGLSMAAAAPGRSSHSGNPPPANKPPCKGGKPAGVPPGPPATPVGPPQGCPPTK